MKEKGIIITSLLYAILAMFILILFTIILTFGIRKNLIDNVSNKIENELDYIAPQITGLSVLPVFTGQTFSEANYAAGLVATDNVDGDVTGSITCSMSTGVISCIATDKSGNISAPFTRTTTTVSALTYHYTGNYQTFVAANTGTYKIELWGAQGGDYLSLFLGGRGGYTAGNIYLTAGTVLYIYVGGSSSTTSGGYNGGGTIGSDQFGYGRAGGGATDVRLINGVWNNKTSLISRIMVAGGGGGADDRDYNDTTCGYGQGTGGYGGGLTGGDGTTTGHTYNSCTYGWGYGSGGSQTVGGTYYGYSSAGVINVTNVSGSFGDANSASIAQAGGGSGYYGGSYGGHGGAGGGSSFISGYTGCNAVTKTGAASGTTIHYSGLVFTAMTMTAGNASMPTTDGASTMTGNANSGYAKITFVSN